MKIEIAGLAGWLVLAAPFVLLLLAGLYYWRRDAGRPHDDGSESGAGSERRDTRDPAPAHAEASAAAQNEPSRAGLAPRDSREASARDAGKQAAATGWPAMAERRAPPAPSTAPTPPPSPRPASTTLAPASRSASPPAASPPPPAAAPAPLPPAAQQQTEAEAEPAPPPPPPRTDFAPIIAAAEAADDIDRLPTLYIALARQQREDGLPDRQVGELLRKSIRMAAMYGQKLAHAVGRIELGDLEAAAGDMTSACEHWQIARSLFLELRQTRDVGTTDQRMRRAGCPTDWVLNDF